MVVRGICNSGCDHKRNTYCMHQHFSILFFSLQKKTYLCIEFLIAITTMSILNKGFLYFICAVSAMGDKEKAKRYLEEVEHLDVNHLGILQFSQFIK